MPRDQTLAALPASVVAAAAATRSLPTHDVPVGPVGPPPTRRDLVVLPVAGVAQVPTGSASELGSASPSATPDRPPPGQPTTTPLGTPEQPSSGLAFQLAVRLDATVGRFRRGLTFATLTFFAFGPRLDDLIGEGGRHGAQPMGYASIAALLLLIFVATLVVLDKSRDDAGHIKASLVIASALPAREDEGAFVFPSLEGTALWVGALLLTVSRILRLFGLRDDILGVAGTIVFLLGLFVWIGRYVAAHSAGVRARLVALELPDRDAVAKEIEQLPPVINCRDRRAVEDAQRHAEHPLVRQTIRVVSEWKPRRRSSEVEYRKQLARFIGRHLPQAMPREEYAVTSDGRVRRLDLVVGDYVAIELKRRTDTSSLDRAHGQVSEYLRIWRKPMLVILCDDGQTNMPRLETMVGAWRQEGHTVLVLIADRG